MAEQKIRSRSFYAMFSHLDNVSEQASNDEHIDTSIKVNGFQIPTDVARDIAISIINSKHVDLLEVLHTSNVIEYNELRADKYKLKNAEYELLKEIFVW